MCFYLVRPKIIFLIHVIILTIIISIAFLSVQSVVNASEVSHTGITFYYFFIAISILGLLRMLWDIYLILYKIPLMIIDEKTIKVKSLFFYYQEFPLSKIDEINIADNKYFFNISIDIKKSSFVNYTKRIYAIDFPQKAENLLAKKGIKISKSIEKTIYLNRE